MKYSYNSNAFEEMTENAYANGATGAIITFMVDGYQAWMRKKTYDERTKKTFMMFLEAIDEMKNHFDEMIKTGE